ncbi:MAG TPA: RdgB/HAM1 family non-canonical purine NTP pyrophosphatase [Chloroflexota bacterium]|nr:RdgB/HAM1 family non-canonical purine NTP pyrophosphatase [Chloroflexota bacterium]
MTKPIIRPDRLLLATSNSGKVAELRGLLATHGNEVVSPREIGLGLSVAETGSTFAENAIMKAEAYAQAAGIVAIADDSGLVVDALGGRPGIFSARFGGPGADDAVRMRLVLDELAAMSGSDRRARFVAVIALAVPGSAAVTFDGRVEGQIAAEPRGSNGFGYDPIFFYSPANATFGELSTRHKGLVSHRARAAARLLGYLRAGTVVEEATYTWPG